MSAVKGLLGILFHTLRQDSIAGWSKVQETSLDMAKITKVEYSPRLFRIWNREYPYTLRITYSEPQTELVPAPVITLHGYIGGTIHHAVKWSSTISRRYKSERHCLDEINEIKRKQGLLDSYIKHLRKDIVTFDAKQDI